MKYYYKDPLAAAWMAKHHGIKFDNGDSLKSACEVAEMDENPIPFIIHPDSLHLLEPQKGDLCSFDFRGDEFYIYDGYEFGNLIKKIIQRNGIAFHWPEVE